MAKATPNDTSRAQPVVTNAANWSVTVFTHRGRGRAANEDAVAADNRIFSGDMAEPETIVISEGSFSVLLADGMGGHVYGATASVAVMHQLASKPASSFFQSETCIATICQANAELYRLMTERTEIRGMGATLIGAAISGEEIAIFNVGDSPAFIHQPGQLLELSVRDVPALKIGASKPRAAHRITQCLGGTMSERAIVPHHTTLRPNWTQDTLLLCSDGLTDTVDEDAIAGILDISRSPNETVAALYREALQTGGHDDVSILLVKQHLEKRNWPLP